MQANQSQPNDSASPTNGQSALHDLFALTDEQILEIEPEAQDVGISSSQQPAAGEEPPRVAPASLPAVSSTNAQQQESPELNRGATQASPNVESTQPPAWLAAQMKDPWSGEEARDLWNGVQQARAEAAAYREVFAKPEDARALKEIYPGGVNEARAVAERARQLDDIDRAYFTGDTAQRSQLAAMMLREDPTAFREMVFEGLRALEKANVAPPGIHPDGVGRAASSTAGAQPEQKDTGLPAGPGHVPPGATSTPEAQRARNEELVARYASFEKAANEELERSVGGAIERTLAQALPAVARTDGAALGGRLSSAIRQDIEKALRGDRQLGEQVAQILSGRRLNDEARGQVVRLIGERAQQLLPGAAKRVINEWTHATLAAHRSRGDRAEAAESRREVAAASSDSRRPFVADASQRSAQTQQSRLEAGATRTNSRGVDYRKLSDEQILEM